jgi:hypothetical protein
LTVLLIIQFDIKIKDLIEAGKDYPWPRPACCPICGGRLHGHGYTARYFDGEPQKIWLKRYRCIDCHAVHTLRPKSHWRRFQATVDIMIQSLRTKIVDGLWLKIFSRQRQQYWFSGFGIQWARHNPPAERISYPHLKSLLSKKIIAATHSLTWFKMVAREAMVLVPTA